MIATSFYFKEKNVNEQPILELKNITKEFSGTVVLEDVSFSLHEGEILGLVGENGAGKTTLMSILFGMPVITETGGYGGSILLNGEESTFTSPFDALDAGIGMVHQEFSLIPGFTVAENILLNREKMHSNIACDIFGRRMSTLDRGAMRSVANDAMSHFGIKIDVDTLVSKMPVGHKQFTEIAREINRKNVKILVLDEPTAVLTESESAILLEALKKLAKDGISIIFISHRLNEVMEICHRVVTLRDGKSIRDVAVADTNVKEIAASMVGREVKSGKQRENRQLSDENVLEIKNLWVDMPGEIVRDVNLSVTKGEILGIGGLAGQGKLGIPNGIMGLFPSGGQVVFDGKELDLNNVELALKSGMAFVSEDRRGVGLLLDRSLDWNIAFTAMQTQNAFLKSFFGGLIKLRDEKAMAELAKKYIEMLSIKCTGYKQRAIELSGGNQQKVCLAKAFCLNPKLLFVSEPTRGIDVGAKEIVLNVLRKVNRESGTTVVMVSSELEELRSVCDRIAIICDGKIAGVLPAGEDATEFAMLMSGA